MIEAIRFIYPDIQDNQFFLQDDGNGPYIKKWTYSQPKPTKTQIDAANVSLKNSVPFEVEMAQARLALLNNGYLPQVTVYLDSLIGLEGEKARIEWEFRRKVQRNHPLVQSLQTHLGLTSKQIDDLFKLAATL